METPAMYQDQPSRGHFPEARAGNRYGSAYEGDHGHESGLGPMILGGLIGFLAGVAVNPARKAMIQGAEAMTGDWYEILKKEHEAVEALLDQLMKPEDDQTRRRQMLLTQIAHSLNKHAVTEENVIYPALRRTDEDAALELGTEHLDIKSLISKLQYDIPKDDPRWKETARELRDLVTSHARDEEERIFPPMRERLTDEENAALDRRLHWEGLKIV
jgi:hemerythrin superfamily protein